MQRYVCKGEQQKLGLQDLSTQISHPLCGLLDLDVQRCFASWPFRVNDSARFGSKLSKTDFIVVTNAGLKRLSKKGRRADALALRADERRDKLRKASGSRT